LAEVAEAALDMAEENDLPLLFRTLLTALESGNVSPEGMAARLRSEVGFDFWPQHSTTQKHSIH
jgi:hypothetical protein